MSANVKRLQRELKSYQPANDIEVPLPSTPLLPVSAFSLPHTPLCQHTSICSLSPTLPPAPQIQSLSGKVQRLEQELRQERKNVKKLDTVKDQLAASKAEAQQLAGELMVARWELQQAEQSKVSAPHHVARSQS